jgi:outer membrane protein OmpA-like peptidoglycan-associated protein
MSNSMVDTIMNMVPAQVTEPLAARLGGSPGAVQSGLGTSVATLLGGIANRAGDSGFMSQVFNLVGGSNTQGILNHLPNLAAGAGASSHAMEQGLRLRSLLFGGQQASLENVIGRQTGLGAAAGSELMSLAAPLTMGFLGQQIRDRGLTPASFASLISAESSKLQGLLPAGLGSFLSGVPTPSLAATVPAGTGGGGMKGLLILIGLLLLGLVAWVVSRGCNKPQSAPAAPAQVAAPAPAAGPLGEFIKRKLPDGTELNIPRLGIENTLIDFIENSSKPADKTTWFDFDRLTFDTGSATLQDSSSEQLQNIAAILKAYPKVKVKIGGYTDNTGNEQANLRLSQDRAMNVMHDLVQRGVEQSRLDAKGYGEEHPVADNATDAGRQKNRRISLLVTEK